VLKSLARHWSTCAVQKAHPAAQEHSFIIILCADIGPYGAEHRSTFAGDDEKQRFRILNGLGEFF